MVSRFCPVRSFIGTLTARERDVLALMAPEPDDYRRVLAVLTYLDAHDRIAS